MAYKRHHRRSHKRTHTKRRRRHHRVGAMSLSAKSPVVMIGAIAAGYFLGDTLTPMIENIIPISDPATKDKVTAGAEIGIGALLLTSRKKSTLKTIAGGILAGAGVKKAAKAFGVISGYGSVPVIGRRRVAGYGSLPVIGAPGYSPGAGQLNGYATPGMIGETVPIHKQVLSGVDEPYYSAGSGSGSGINVSDR